jgi:hypothetical protein
MAVKSQKAPLKGKFNMKQISLLLVLILFVTTVFAGQRMRPDGSGGWIMEEESVGMGMSAGWKAADRAQRAERESRQQQLLQEQQIENQRLQNELLRRQLQLQPAKPVDYSKSPEFISWQSDNLWYGSDRPKTEFALLYAKQLKQEHPDLVGRSFLDAVSAKVKEVFAENK